MIKHLMRQSMPGSECRPVISLIVVGLITFTGVSDAFSSDALPQQARKDQTEKSDQQPRASENVQFVSTNWGVNCQPQANSKKLACVLSQSILMAKTRQVFVSVSIHATPAKAKTPPYMATVRLPHGLALASGIQFQIDKQRPGRLTVYTSSPQGVFARVGVINKLLSSLKKGRQLKIIFQGRNGRKFTMSMSLKGFTAGFEKLK